MRLVRLCGALLGIACCATVLAADEPLAFADAVEQQRYASLLEELRCLVCQNQSLADSHADLAQDLRNEVYRMVDEGIDNAAILEFMVARYGDFVLYRPPVKSSTWLLWLGPLFLLVGGLGVVVFVARRRPRHASDLTDEESARLARLIRQHREQS